MHTRYFSSRFYFLQLFFCVFVCFILFRLLYIQLFRSSYLNTLARKQHSLYVEIEPQRGRIFDRDMRLQAVNIPVDSLYAVPPEIDDKSSVSRTLSAILDMDQDSIRKKIGKDKKQFVWVVRKLPYDVSERVKGLKLKGLGFIKESKRSYPNGSLAAHILGFVGIDNDGLEGLELVCDKYLRGENGWGYGLRDARQRQLSLWDEMILPKDGFDLVLTIDEIIQFVAERELENACKLNHARAGMVVVMDPSTGEILALANWPKFDPNLSSDRNPDSVRNRAICDMYEPGSVFKIVTASAALEENRFSEEDKIFCENGSYRLANHTLHDHTKHGILAFKDVIGQSSNIGTVKVAQKLGADIVYKYAKLFRFGEKTGIDLRGEIGGSLKKPRYWSKTSIGAVPIGQEVGVTAVQLACAISAIANGGEMMRPYVIKRVQDKLGEVIKEYSPRSSGRAVSASTAARMRSILKGVVDSGTGTRARMDSFTAGGKTGTAQKIGDDGRYSHNKFVGTFIGFAPVNNPRLAIVVSLDEPHPYYFGGVVSAPVFKNIAEYSLKYLGVVPDKESGDKKEDNKMVSGD